jgi:1-acyl-sn-glycerol-3-phosphate acyltransferase
VETPGDLVAAVRAAHPQAPARRDGAAARPTLPQTAEPIAATTLAEVLTAGSRAHGERPHIYLRRGSDDEDVITYAELERAACAVAGGLIERRLQPGERIAIMLPTERGFFDAFFGVLFAGGIPVPIYPPFRRAQMEDHLRRQAGILRNAQASMLITNEEIGMVAGLLRGLVESLREIATVAQLSRSEAIPAPLPSTPDATALIQYTSGSTGDPKGVVLSHANLLANIRALGHALGASSSDTVVSWLPLYHDMGLIGCWLGSLYFGAPVAIMSPLSFLADPARWLWAIHAHHATLSAGPNFAFELCLKSIRDGDLEGLDLSSLRAVMNGAEPVSPSTIKRFAERFGRYSFQAQAMTPVYGLAESSVGLAFPPIGRGPVIDRVDRHTLTTRGVAAPAKPDDEKALEFVACGQPLPGHEVRIVDESGREVPERHEGRLQFKGPSTTSGYFHNPEKTRELFSGDWLESGDRAYVAAGDVFITGRIKDMIKRAGRNIYPQELEEFVGTIEGVRKGCVAAFASPDPRTGTERLIIVAETRLREASELEALRRKIVEAAQAILDLAPDDVVLEPPHTVPKTSSGKIRRSAARALYESGTLGQRHASVWVQAIRLSLAGIAPRLRRLGERLRGLSYGAFWWALLSAIAVPLWLLVMVLPFRRWRHAALGAAARLFFRLTGTPLAVTSDANVPQDRVILVANHASYLDGAVLYAACGGPLTFVAKEELAGQRIAGPFLRRLGTVFVRRTDAAGAVGDTQAILDIVRAGARVAWFPEGTFARMPGLLGFRLGAFVVAAQAGIPVVPVTIRGTRSILRANQWLPRRGAIFVHIGRPLTADGDDFDAALRLRDRARQAILLRCEEPDLSEERVTFG